MEHGGTNYTTNNTVLLLDSIGEEDEKALICRTDLRFCCNDTMFGKWLYPDKTFVPKRMTNMSFYCDQHDAGRIFLRRRYNAMSPLGTYCCMAPNINNSDSDETLCVFLSKSWNA